jgi:formate hydrogenlyase subunit 3/multisubunit Na+/H+ antiporter MnhD subunit
LPGIAAWAAVGSVLLVLGAGIAYAMTHTISAEDVEAEIPPELELATPLTAAPPPDGEDREAA